MAIIQYDLITLFEPTPLDGDEPILRRIGGVYVPRHAPGDNSEAGDAHPRPGEPFWDYMRRVRGRYKTPNND